MNPGGIGRTGFLPGKTGTWAAVCSDRFWKVLLWSMGGDPTHGVWVTGRPICLNPQEPHLEEFPKMTMSINNGWVRSLTARNYLDFHSNIKVLRKSVLHKKKLKKGKYIGIQTKTWYHTMKVWKRQDQRRKWAKVSWSEEDIHIVYPKHW